MRTARNAPTQPRRQHPGWPAVAWAALWLVLAAVCLL